MLKDDYSVGSNIRDIREQLESCERKLNQKGLKVFARALGVTVQDILAGI